LGSLYASFWLREDMADWTGGFNAWSRRALEQIVLSSIQSRGYAFQIELKYRCFQRGLRLVEVPIIFQERRAGQSKMSGDIVKEALWGVIKLRLRAEKAALFR